MLQAVQAAVCVSCAVGAGMCSPYLSAPARLCLRVCPAHASATLSCLLQVSLRPDYLCSGLRYSASAFFCNYFTVLLTMLVAQSWGLLLGTILMDPKT